MLELCTSGCGWSVYRNIRWGPEKPNRMSWGVKVLTVSEQWIHKWKETMFKVLNKPSCIIFSVIDLSCMYAVFHQAFLCNTLFMRCKFYTHSDIDHKTIGFWLLFALFRHVLQVSTPHPSSPIYSFETANCWQQKPPIPSFSFRRRHDYFDLQVQEEKVGDSKLISQTSYSPLAISELSSKEIWDCCPFSHLSHESPLVPFFHCLYLNFLTDWSETCFLLLVLEE